MKNNEIVLFETKDKEVTLSVPMDGDTVWLTQAQMTELFNVDRPVQFYSLDVIICNRCKDNLKLFKVLEAQKLREPRLLGFF